MENVLECSNLTKKYITKTALDDLNFSLPKGAIIGLLGPNGSGKTTLLKLAAGLLKPSSGEIKVCGLRPSAISKALDMLANLNINPKDKLKTMSKGTKEKVQLIITMSREVPLYLLDEPIGGVDPAARDYILNTIISNYKEDSTVVLSTHLISDIESVLNHIIFLKEGKIVRQGDVDDIRESTGKSIDALFREEFRC